MNVTTTANDHIKHEIDDDDYSHPLNVNGFHDVHPDKEAFVTTSQFEHQQEVFIKSNLEDIDVKLEPLSPPTEKIYIKQELLEHSGVYEEETNFGSSEDVGSDTAEVEPYPAYPGKSNLSEVSNVLNSSIKEETLSVTYDTDGSDLVDEEYEFSDNKTQNLYNQTKECYISAANTNITNQKVQSVRNQITNHEDETNRYNPSPREVDNAYTVSKDQISQGSNSTDEDDIFREEHHLETFKREEPLNTKPFRCNVCDARLTQKQSLDRHMQTQHTGEKPFQCKVCKYSTVRKHDLIIHMRTHTGEKPFQCKVCEYRTIRKHDLIVHMRTHTDEKPFQCKVCEYSTVRNHDFIRHMRTHTVEKPFQCNVCDYKAVQKPNFIVHMRTHTGEKPFQCNVCEYSTVRKRHLIEHIQSHTGAKPFQCNVCDYKTGKKQNLNRHMRTHTGEKPFQCDICDYRTVDKRNLIKHKRTHTGEKPFQ